MSPGLAVKAGAYVFSFLLVAGLIFGLVGFEGVSEGHVKVVTYKGDAVRTLEPGQWYWENPITTGTHEINVRPQIYEMVQAQGEGDKADKNDAVEVTTGDGERVPIDVAVTYRVTDPITFYSEYKTQEYAENVLIRNTGRAAVYTEAGGIPVAHLPSKDGRLRLKKATVNALNRDFKGQGIHLVSVDIRDVHLPRGYLQSVSAKNQKRQQLQAERIESERKIVEADADAERELIQAEATAERNRIEARGQARANEIVEESLTDKVLIEHYTQGLDNSDVVYVPIGNEDGLPTYLEVDEGNSTEDGR